MSNVTDSDAKDAPNNAIACKTERKMYSHKNSFIDILTWCAIKNPTQQSHKFYQADTFTPKDNNPNITCTFN